MQTLGRYVFKEEQFQIRRSHRGQRHKSMKLHHHTAVSHHKRANNHSYLHFPGSGREKLDMLENLPGNTAQKILNVDLSFVYSVKIFVNQIKT